jgi:hypothetical protein
MYPTIEVAFGLKNMPKFLSSAMRLPLPGQNLAVAHFASEILDKIILAEIDGKPLRKNLTVMPIVIIETGFGRRWLLI